MRPLFASLPRRFFNTLRAVAVFAAAVIAHALWAAAPTTPATPNRAVNQHSWTTWLQSIASTRNQGRLDLARVRYLASALPQNPAAQAAWPATNRRLLGLRGLWSAEHTRPALVPRRTRPLSANRFASAPSNPYATFTRDLLHHLYAGGLAPADWHPYSAADELTPNFQTDMGDGESFHVATYRRAARTSDSTTAANYREICRQLEEREVALIDSLLMTSAQSAWAVLANASNYPNPDALLDAVIDAVVVSLQQVDDATYAEIIINAPLLADAAVSYSGSDSGLRARAYLYYAALTAIAGKVYLAIDPSALSTEDQHSYAELGPIVAKEVFKFAKLAAALRPLYRDLGAAIIEKHDAHYYSTSTGYYTDPSRTGAQARLNALSLIALAQGFPVTQNSRYLDRAVQVIAAIRYGNSGSCYWLEIPASGTTPTCGAHYQRLGGGAWSAVTYSNCNLMTDALLSWAAFSSANRASYLEQATKIINYTNYYLYDPQAERVMHDASHDSTTGALVARDDQHCSGCNAYGALLMQGHSTGAAVNP